MELGEGMDERSVNGLKWRRDVLQHLEWTDRNG